jgi:hypothetical protein
MKSRIDQSDFQRPCLATSAGPDGEPGSAGGATSGNCLNFLGKSAAQTKISRPRRLQFTYESTPILTCNMPTPKKKNLTPQHGLNSRRSWLKGAVALGSLATAGLSAQATARPKIAAIFTELRFRSHAYNLLVNLMGRYLFRGQPVDSGVEVVSFFADQFPAGDMTREASKRFGVPLFSSIDQALCLGGKSLAVDGVLLVGEHGEYPTNELGQRMYPRKEFFDAVVAVMQRSGRYVPVFNDKHLSYRWDWAKEMYDEAQKLGIPLMAGSSVPLAQRVPPIEIPAGAPVEEAVSVHAGGIESYDFHALEVLQSLIEARPGGETGVSQVELVAGEAFEAAQAKGRWSIDLGAAAMAAEEKANFQRQSRPGAMPALANVKARHALIVTYKDGTRGTALCIGSTPDRWNFACRLRGTKEPLATALFNGPWGNLNLFTALSNAIVHFFKTGKSPYPVERTLLVSGILDAAMHSHKAGGQPVATPHLEFAYQPRDFSAFRETGENWQIITKETPQPTTFEPYRH